MKTELLFRSKSRIMSIGNPPKNGGLPFNVGREFAIESINVVPLNRIKAVRTPGKIQGNLT